MSSQFSGPQLFVVAKFKRAPTGAQCSECAQGGHLQGFPDLVEVVERQY